MTEDAIALHLEEIDVDAAVQENAAAAASSRAGFLRRIGAGGATVVGGGALLGALPKLASAATIPESDVAILNFALSLEYLESAFYTEANANTKLKGETARFARVAANHEYAHVKFLQSILGARAIAAPRFDFKGATSDQGRFQATADVLENTGVHAYLGQMSSIKNANVLTGAGRILPVEARHAAWIRDIRFRGGTSVGTTPAPGAFEDGFSTGKIAGIVNGMGFVTG
jgi:Ferritin-like domain